jgi:hypothetical protein
MSSHLKQITTQAKRIRKSNPGLPWTECVSQASRDLGYGTSVGRKPKYRVYATPIKRKTKAKAKAKKVAPKPIVKAKAMPKAKPVAKPKAKRVYTKKQIDPGKNIKTKAPAIITPKQIKLTGEAWYTGNFLPSLSQKPKHMTSAQYYSLQNAVMSADDKRVLWNSYRNNPAFPFDRMFSKYNKGNYEVSDSDYVMVKKKKPVVKKGLSVQDSIKWLTSDPDGNKHLFNTKTPDIAKQELMKGNIVYKVEPKESNPINRVYNHYDVRPSRYIEYWSVYKPKNPKVGALTRQQKLENKDIDAYKYFVVSQDGKIDSGWEYKSDAEDQAKEHNEYPYQGKQWSVISLRTLKQRGLQDPRNNWKHVGGMTKLKPKIKNIGNITLK